MQFELRCVSTEKRVPYSDWRPNTPNGAYDKTKVNRNDSVFARYSMGDNAGELCAGEFRTLRPAMT